MPLYDYECQKCHHTFVEQRSVATRRTVVCPICHGSTSIVIGQVNYHRFTPHYNIKLGEYVSSNSDKKRILKEKGLMSVGDAGYEEVEREARSNRKFRDEQRRKKRKREFCESETWQKHGHKLRSP